MSTLHEAKDRLLEAAGTVEVLATALGELNASDCPGGYSACYAIKRLIDQALEVIEAVETEGAQ